MFDWMTDEKLEGYSEWVAEKLDETNLSNKVKGIIFTIVDGFLWFAKGALESMIVIGAIWGYIQVCKNHRRR